MTYAQELHLEQIKIHFKERVDSKYRAGAVEHGGDLCDMSEILLVQNAMDECIDQFTYLATLLDKIRNRFKHTNTCNAVLVSGTDCNCHVRTNQK